MTTSLNEIVNVSITRSTATISQAGFGTCLILGKATRITGGAELVRSYTSTTAVLVDYLSTDFEYKLAAALLGQSPKVTAVKIAKDTSVAGQCTITLNQVMGIGDKIDMVVCGHAISQSYAAGAADTTTLAGKIAALTDHVASATVSGGDKVITVVFAKNSATTVSGIVVTTILGLTCVYLSTVTAVSMANLLGTISLEDDDWYGLVCETIVELDVKDVAASIETQRKLYATRTAAAAVITSGTTDIAYVLHALGYDRTIVMYSDNVTTQFPDAAMFGKLLPAIPGSITLKFKTMAGVAATSLTSTQAGYAQGKYANLYRAIGGVSMISEGVCASDEYADVMHGIDWLQAKIEEGVFGRLVLTNKVPYTQAGATLIENEIRQPLDLAVTNGLLASYTVTVPDVSAALTADKALRFMTGFSFTGILAGAVHKTTIVGTITL